MKIQIIKILTLFFIFHIWIAISGCSNDKVEGEIFGTEPGIQGVVFNFVGPPGRQEASGSADGKGSEARFSLPRGITSDGTYLYVADTANNSIRRIGILNRVVERIAGTPESSGVIDNVPGDIAQFNQPWDVIINGNNLYITDLGNNAIRRIELLSGHFVVNAIAGEPGSFEDSIDGIGSAARFSALRGITTDGTNLYMADGHAIRMLVIETSEVITLAGGLDTEIGAGDNDGNGLTARFNNPEDIVVDGNRLYVADSGNNMIRMLTLPGDLNQLITDGTFDRGTIIVETIAGEAGNPSPQDGFDTDARFSFPRGIAIFDGYLYIADTGNHTIRRMDLTTREVITLAGSFGQMGFVVKEEGAVGESARFSSPQGIVVDAEGNSIYVTNTNLNHIVVIR